MAKMRDRMIYWYFEVDEEIVWNTIKEQFSILKDNIYKMKQELL